MRERQSTHLPDADYRRAGLYFVTVVVHTREPLFGEVTNSLLRANTAGEMVRLAWFELPNRYTNIELDALVVMPNHFHGIIRLVEASASLGDAKEGHPSLHEVIAAFKSLTTLAYVRGVHEQGWPTFDRHLWQRGYYERIVRNPAELDRIRRYIADNPANWPGDRENPVNAAK